MYNKVTLIGHLGADPEARRLNNGGTVVNIRLATTESWRDKATGERKERTEWHTVVIWNEHLGKVAEDYLKKGSKCLLEGKLQTRKWQDKDGNDRYSTEVVLSDYDGKLVLLGDPGRSDDNSRSDRRDRDDGGRDISRGDGHHRGGDPEAGRGRAATQSRRVMDEMDDEIPF